ncbi:two-component system, OmpR family, sensor histidine kinase ChvG [Enhydrobacter aerosaccus]|uniref:histidine kinase n=1 Tax=Enhydrobacter aerosaccus TaxID=225324 RepID=A0A1T4SVH6_9HYPH|nr:stimulus-sensing domain-containing protein [Enhydrobacter aerosaccus]SKA32156.1 two-component system, OmpR family, sensor histidine kinase ChvG [Enhydrobacter aerosaccus]
MASDTDIATPDSRWRRPLAAALKRLLWPFRRAPVAAPTETPSLLRRRRHHGRRYSPLTRRILLLNIVPVALLALGAVYLSDYEDELIDAELASLLVQGEMVAAGIGEVAVVGGETTVNRLDADAARQLLTRLVHPTGVRARLFSETGELLGDSALMSDAGRIHSVPLPPPQDQANDQSEERFGESIADWIARQLSRADRYPQYVERSNPSVRDFPEAASALRGFNASAVRVTSDGRLLLSAAVPVQRFKQVMGALLLTRDNRAIAASLREVRYDMLTIAVAALGITVLLSLYLAGTITQPIVRLARAADVVRLARDTRPEIPDLGRRGDEIGDLNDALRSMTDALWQRLNAIESFAADVAHELKNPLTSLRSAIEVAARPDLEPDRRAKLMSIVVDDVNRLNRLISDISDASRLDAELMRGEVKPVDLQALLSDMARHYTNTTANKSGVTVEFRVAANPPFAAHGHDGRYGQVFRNVVDNALSFSPPGSRIVIELSRETRNGPFVVTIDDEGPGIPEDNLESIFQRFYSERPTEHFGQHSGLGLSICRQIMETYGGSISASNRKAPDGRIVGARFTMRIPAAGRGA